MRSFVLNQRCEGYVYTRSKEVGMRYLCTLIVMTAVVFVAAGSTRGITSPGPLLLNPTALAASENPQQPPPRSKRCPPEPKGDPRDSKCGKGNHSKLP